MPLSEDEENPVLLWKEIWLLREEIKGPTGYATWQDAAIAEKLKRIELEKENTVLREKLKRKKK
jgi:hypothetical protein